MLIIGPNPRDKTRDGGVAKYMGYIEKNNLGCSYDVVLKYTDIDFFLELVP